MKKIREEMIFEDFEKLRMEEMARGYQRFLESRGMGDWDSDEYEPKITQEGNVVTFTLNRKELKAS
jgi:hypothetical protein